MRGIKKFFLVLLGSICAFYAICFFLGGVMILVKGEFFSKKGLIVMIAAIIFAVLFVIAAKKLFQKVKELSIGKNVSQKTKQTSISSVTNQDLTQVSPSTGAVPIQRNDAALQPVTPKPIHPIGNIRDAQSSSIPQQQMPGDIQRQNAQKPVVNIEHQVVPIEVNNALTIEKYAIPGEVKELLWIRGKEQTYDHNLLNEPSLIDPTLEVRCDINNPIQDIGYYPNYRNLKAADRYVYLNWLKNVAAPIPIGYVFIFYYGLERHLLFGKFEQAFDMIVKLRRFHNNSSFNAYSADALLIAALYHKRGDFISKIDLNKATTKLAQFVIASLTGKIESGLLVENCGDVGFTNKRYIKSDYELFKLTLETVLREKFGDTYYPVQEDDFLKCKGTFPLVLANYSLKMENRIVNAPDLSTNVEYRKNVFDILNDTHERVKKNKKKERAGGDGADGESKVLEGYKEIDLKNYLDVQKEYDFLVSRVAYSKSPHEDIPFSFEEEVFFKELIKAMKENKLWEKEGLKLKRLVNNTFNVDCNTCFIGKVKLRDKMFIQVQKGANQVKTYSVGDLMECLNKIPAWIRYIKYCRRN